MTAPLAITMGDAAGVGPEILLRRFTTDAMVDVVDGVYERLLA